MDKIFPLSIYSYYNRHKEIEVKGSIINLIKFGFHEIAYLSRVVKLKYSNFIIFISSLILLL